MPDRQRGHFLALCQGVAHHLDLRHLWLGGGNGGRCWGSMPGRLQAIGTAAVQASGLVEALGTMAKSVSVGNAARNGLLSALLAARGLAGPAAPLSGERGWLRVHAQRPSLVALTEGLGRDWEIAANTYKPYPVGVVLNPVIDACLELGEREGVALENVASTTLTGHALLRQRDDRPEVRTRARVAGQCPVCRRRRPAGRGWTSSPTRRLPRRCGSVARRSNSGTSRPATSPRSRW